MAPDKLKFWGYAVKLNEIHEKSWNKYQQAMLCMFLSMVIWSSLGYLTAFGWLSWNVIENILVEWVDICRSWVKFQKNIWQLNQRLDETTGWFFYWPLWIRRLFNLSPHYPWNHGQVGSTLRRSIPHIGWDTILLLHLPCIVGINFPWALCFFFFFVESLEHFVRGYFKVNKEEHRNTR